MVRYEFVFAFSGIVITCSKLVTCHLNVGFFFFTMKVSVLNTVDTSHEDMIVSIWL